MDLAEHRRLLNRKGSDSVKEWTTLVDSSKTVENVSTIEFDLANAELHDDFRMYFEIDKNANDDGAAHNLGININGMGVGYFSFNAKFDNYLYGYFEVEKIPKKKLTQIPMNIVSPAFNKTTPSIMLECIGTETGTGKLTFSFPSNYKYTGTFKAQLYAR